MKKILIILLLLIILSLSGCKRNHVFDTTSETTPTVIVTNTEIKPTDIQENPTEITPIVTNTEISPTPTKSLPNNAIDINDNGDKPTVKNEVVIEPISRPVAGLDTIDRYDFTHVLMNKRISEIVLEGKEHTDEDMKSGILSNLIITKRFNEEILDNISINTSTEDVIRHLGTPSFIIDDLIFYKTQEYYIGFYGKDKVELAIVRKMPKQYNKNILNMLLKGICSEQIHLYEYNEFFDIQGSIHGGGYYAEAYNGVSITTDTTDYQVEVYNNFEGNLYMTIPDLQYNVKFINNDYCIDRMVNEVKWYYSDIEEFINDGKLSPSGKYIAKYDWATSMVHYFTIRKIDNSVADFKISVPAREYAWLNDDYILYLDKDTSIPYVVRVIDDPTKRETINLMPMVEDDAFDSPYQFVIQEVRTDAIIIKDENAEDKDDVNNLEKVLWEIKYHIDEDKNFIIDTTFR